MTTERAVMPYTLDKWDGWREYKVSMGWQTQLTIFEEENSYTCDPKSVIHTKRISTCYI